MKTVEGLGELEPTCMNLAIFILFILFLFLATTETSKKRISNFSFLFLILASDKSPGKRKPKKAVDCVTRPSVRPSSSSCWLVVLGSAAAFVPESWLLLLRRRAEGSKSQRTQKPKHNNIKYVDQKLLQMGFDVSATQSSPLLAGFASGIPGFVISLLLLLLLLLDSLPLLFPPHLLGRQLPNSQNAYYPPPQSFLSRFPPLYPHLTHPGT